MTTRHPLPAIEDNRTPEAQRQVFSSPRSHALTADLGRCDVAMNASTARAQPIEIPAGRVVDAQHLFEVELQRRELLLESLPTRTLQSAEITRGEPPPERDSIVVAVTDDGDLRHL